MSTDLRGGLADRDTRDRGEACKRVVTDLGYVSYVESLDEGNVIKPGRIFCLFKGRNLAVSVACLGDVHRTVVKDLSLDFTVVKKEGCENVTGLVGDVVAGTAEIAKILTESYI